jgi:SAM-dependent methyltransferase
MAENRKPQTSGLNGRLWGARARDWAEYQERVHSPIYKAAFARTNIRPGTQYLDAGCGAGTAAELAAERGAQVSGIDAAAALLEVARMRVPGADFRLGDLEQLPFADDTFDIVTGFNSFQYAGNPQFALAEARRVAKPGGSVVIATWGNPEGMQAASVIGALRPLMPAPPPGAPGPFALSDAGALRQFAMDAGLDPVEVFDVDCPFIYANEAAALRALNSSGVATRAMENTSERAVTEAHSKAIEPFRLSDGSYRIEASFRCLLSRS